MSCIVNMNHNCIRHSCLVEERGAALRQERQVLNATKAALKHSDGRHYLLNSHLHRSYAELFHLYPRIVNCMSGEEIAKLASMMC
jgi:hypothetical protein